MRVFRILSILGLAFFQILAYGRAAYQISGTVGDFSSKSVVIKTPATEFTLNRELLGPGFAKATLVPGQKVTALVPAEAFIRTRSLLPPPAAAPAESSGTQRR